MQIRLQVATRSCSPQCSHVSRISSTNVKQGGRGKPSREARLRVHCKATWWNLSSTPLLLYCHLLCLFTYSRGSKSLTRKSSPNDMHLLSCWDTLPVPLLPLSQSQFLLKEDSKWQLFNRPFRLGIECPETRCSSHRDIACTASRSGRQPPAVQKQK